MVKFIERSFPEWEIYISPQLNDSEYATFEVLQKIESVRKINYNTKLHLSVSMRSFRAENVSLLIKQILDLNIDEAKKTLKILAKNIQLLLLVISKKQKNG